VKILIGYESSGVVREAFRTLGHDAWSCDLQPADDDSRFHFQCDVFDVAHREWDMGIFHPPCTYLTISAAWAFGDGPYHQKVKPGTLVGKARRDARDDALDEVRRLMILPYPKAIENPTGFINTSIRKPDQIIQPYYFGEDASKGTCLWLDRLPLLKMTKFIEPRMVCKCGRTYRASEEFKHGCPKCGPGHAQPRWANQTDSGQNNIGPRKGRWKERSRTYPGIAQAMAKQWSSQNETCGVNFKL
jgi:hypothetical protein